MIADSTLNYKNAWRGFSFWIANVCKNCVLKWGEVKLVSTKIEKCLIFDHKRGTDTEPYVKREKSILENVTASLLVVLFAVPCCLRLTTQYFSVGPWPTDCAIELFNNIVFMLRQWQQRWLPDDVTIHETSY